MSERPPALPPREDWDGLAGLLALGALEGEELAEAEALARREPAFALLVLDWHLRLAPLGEAFAPLPPPAGALERIERALPAAGPGAAGSGAADLGARLAGSLLRRLAAWRWVAAGLAVATVVLAVLAARPDLIHPPPAERFVAVLGEGEQQPRFLVTVDLASRQVSVVAVQGVPPHEGDLELWLVRPESGAQSLGLIPAAGAARLDIGQRATPALLSGGLLAVSQEPRGGSPTGQPTGPVVFTGPLLQAPD
jgi:anti-sigma-K factor RskA